MDEPPETRQVSLISPSSVKGPATPVTVWPCWLTISGLLGGTATDNNDTNWFIQLPKVWHHHEVRKRVVRSILTAFRVYDR